MASVKNAASHRPMVRGHDKEISVCAAFTFCAASNSNGATCFHSCHDMVVPLAEEVDVIDGAVACADSAVVDTLVDALAEEVEVIDGAAACADAAVVDALVDALVEEAVALDGAVACADAAVVDALAAPAAAEFTAAASGTVTVTCVRFT